jgi:hypothetical protein
MFPLKPSNFLLDSSALGCPLNRWLKDSATQQSAPPDLLHWFSLVMEKNKRLVSYVNSTLQSLPKGVLWWSAPLAG